MRYMLLLHYAERLVETLDEATVAEAQADFASYAATLHAAGALVGAEVLRGSESSTTVRVGDDGLRIQDGPFADTQEQLGGVFVIEVADLDEAIDLASRAPSARWGAVEVRPSATHTVGGTWT